MTNFLTFFQRPTDCVYIAKLFSTEQNAALNLSRIKNECHIKWLEMCAQFYSRKAHCLLKKNKKNQKKTAVEMLVLRHYDLMFSSKWNQVIEYVVHINVVVADKLYYFYDRVLRLDPGLFHSECLAKIYLQNSPHLTAFFNTPLLTSVIEPPL